MKRKKIKVNLYLTTSAVLFLVICFYFLVIPYNYGFHKLLIKETKINNSVFTLLDFQSCGVSCATCKGFRENLYLYSVDSPTGDNIYKFVKSFEFQFPYYCSAKFIFQKSKNIQENWKAFANSNPTTTYPESFIAYSLAENGSIFFMDLANGKANGKFKVFHDGKLFIDQDIINSKQEGNRFVYKDDYILKKVYKNDSCIFSDTIKIK